MKVPLPMRPHAGSVREVRLHLFFDHDGAEMHRLDVLDDCDTSRIQVQDLTALIHHHRVRWCQRAWQASWRGLLITFF